MNFHNLGSEPFIPAAHAHGGAMVPPGAHAGAMAGVYEPPSMEGEYMGIHSVLADGGDQFGVSTVAFDTQEELTWMGNQGGHVTSYYGLDMQKYTSFQVHATNEIRQILTVDSRVLPLASDTLCCYSKCGRRLFSYMNATMADMQCMLLTSPSTVLLGGHHPVVTELDINTQKEIRMVEVNEPGCAIFRYSNNHICAGNTSGQVTIHDPKSLRVEHVLEAHTGTLSDFDVQGNQLITCGFSSRMGNLTIDRYLMMYDLRMMRSMSPLQVPLEPMFIRFVPTYSDRICCVSQTGHFQVLEQGSLTPTSMIMYQVMTEGALVTSFDLSATYQCMLFGDNGGFLHLFSSGDPQALFNHYAQETVFAHVEPPRPPVSFCDVMYPMSTMPMQYPNHGPLLSDWPDHLTNRMYRKTIPVDPELIHAVKMMQNFGYAPNPGNRHRNQMPYKLPTTHQSGKGERKSSIPESPLGRGDDPFLVVPKKYRKVEIKYSKLGVEDFDFRHYNKTNFAGLETHIPNAYCNSMLQMLYFIEPLRCSLLSHLCEKEFCLSCELGFLFHMLDRQKGKTCQANNFLRAFRTIPEASALSLVLGDAEESLGKVNLPRIIQSWNRFILQQVHAELVDAMQADEKKLSPVTEGMKLLDMKKDKEGEKKAEDQSQKAADSSKAADAEKAGGSKASDKAGGPPEGAKGKDGDKSSGKTEGGDGAKAEENKDKKKQPEIVPLREMHESVITRLFGSKMRNMFTCRCSQEMGREMMATVFDLMYPELHKEGSNNPIEYTFGQVVERSLHLEQNTQAWCNSCDKYQPHLQMKFVESLPDVLVFNTHLENSRQFEFWKAQEEIAKTKNAKETAFPELYTKRPMKPCRYGVSCTRKDCKFWHENREELPPEIPFDESIIPTWLPIAIKVRLTADSKLTVENIDTEDEVPNEWHEKDVVYYDMIGNVCHVIDGKTGGNLVCHVKVGEHYHRRKENVTCTQWYLINDFAISPIETYESQLFNLDWKVPCIVYFVRRGLTRRHDLTVKCPINAESLYQYASLVTPRRRHVTFTPLDETELPKDGNVVGLDAEFVTLNQEEAELRSDGTRSTIKPSQMSVARITCIRGNQGPLAGEPFIDDYISTQEQVVDYLTQFSGIQPGDLDANMSSKHLTTLKSTYLKLRYLVDNTVTFVGHGLKKDFRVINLVVHKDQVIDTVELFHLPRQRMISLKFLAWYFLGINIQSVVHDSIEDARTALKLYQLYQDICKHGMDKINLMLKDMYEIGRKLKWALPEDSNETGFDKELFMKTYVEKDQEKTEK